MKTSEGIKRRRKAGSGQIGGPTASKSGRKEREKKTLDILENIEIAYYELDLSGNLTYFNDIVCGDLGYNREELLGKNFRSIVKPEAIDQIQSIFNEIYRTGRPKTMFKVELVRKDGSTLIVEQSASLMRGPSGKIIGFRGVSRDVTEKIKAERAIRRSEEKYRHILENIDEGYYETDLSGNFTFVNDAGCRITGYERNEIIGTNYKSYTSPQTAAFLLKAFHRIYETGQSEALLDYDVILKDGSVRYYEMSVGLLRDESGKPEGYHILARDVTSRKQAQEALRKSEVKYRTILDIMEEGYFETDLKGTITFVNEAGSRLLGYAYGELIGRSFRHNHTAETIPRINEFYNRVFMTGMPEFLMDYEVIRKDGAKRIHQANVALIRDTSGKPIGFRVLARDVTERKKVEDDLRKSEEKYRTILESIEDMYIENDLWGNALFVNDAGCRIMRYSRDELIGTNYRRFYSPAVARRLKEVYNRILKTGKPEHFLDYEVISRDGSVRILQSNIGLMRDATGKAIGFRTLARDVTERKKAELERARIEEQLLQAKKMESVGRLAGGVAHDFNNMLTVILGYAELIRSRLHQNDPVLADLKEIEKAAGRSRDLTRQLLAFSRKEIIAPRTVDLNLLIVDAKKTIPRLIGEDIELKFYPGNDLWKIRFDPSQIEHVLINLAANARDAMPSGGRLTIETENVHLNEAYCRLHPGFIAGFYVMLGVSDDGIGMDKETAEHIFEPFFTTKETGKGTGLGLATVYGIITQNGGFIHVYSEPGKGTTFKMYIPRSDEKMQEPEIDEETSISVGEGTVLLVEDDDMVRKMTAEMLEAIGYTAISTGNPKEALSIIEKDTPIHLVITDVVMPIMSGKELGERIEAIRPGTKVLFMSGYTTNVMAHRGVLDQGVHFIQKPFSLGDLAEKIREILKGN